ncbi:MAG: tRNA (adenosine(37)-N6)-threonylcarbamoyltransferase complex dimerization subunit type 1 TsaB [Spirochaetaceae bacterium]
MNILALDTSTTALNISLLRENKLFEVFFDFGLHHTEHLAVETEKLLTRAEIRVEDLDLIGCTSGPGSFTGLRIGISFAKGYAYGASIPLVFIPTLELLAYGKEFFPGVVFPVIDARKKRIYTAGYEAGKRISDFLDIPPEKLIEHLPSGKRALLTGPYAYRVFDILGSLHSQSSLPLPDKTAGQSRGRALVELTEDRYNSFGGSEESAGPFYMRASEAELSAATKRKTAHE